MTQRNGTALKFRALCDAADDPRRDAAADGGCCVSDTRLTCRCVAVADGWVRHPINVYGECVVCRGRVFSTVAGRLAGRPEGPVSRARNTRVPSGRSAGCCGDPSDCVCEEAA